MDRTCQYIPHAQRAAYERDGWTVEELPMPHAHYSLLAWRDRQPVAAQQRSVKSTPEGE